MATSLSSSPIAFGCVQKRRFECSSPHDLLAASAAAADAMDCSSGFHSAKRRRKGNSDGGDAFSLRAKENWTLSPFVQSASAAQSAAFGQPSNKRSRTSLDGSSFTIDAANSAKILELNRIIEEQSSQITELKSNKDASQTEVSQLSAQNQKLDGENKILKRAVTIQQERQHQVNAELEEARDYKVQAEDRIRRLEQMCLTLQYQLSAHSAGAGNDFMGVSPPDVY